MLWISLVLATAIPGVLIVGYLNRKGKKDDDAKGIGWQFIRYTVLSIAIPVVGILALNSALTGEAATLIGSAMGFAFGKTSEKVNRLRKTQHGSKNDDGSVVDTQEVAG